MKQLVAVAFLVLAQAFANPTVTISQTDKIPQVSLEWEANPVEQNVAGYYIYLWPTNPSPEVQRIQVPNTTNYTLTGLVEGRSYQAAVSAYDYSGMEGALSSSVSFTAGPGERMIYVSASSGTLQKSFDLKTWKNIPSPYLTSERSEPRVFFRIFTAD